MIIDNGEKVRLVVDGVFAGYAGLSRGTLAFKPNLVGKQVQHIMGGLLNGNPVLLKRQPSMNAGIVCASFEAIA